MWTTAELEAAYPGLVVPAYHRVPKWVDTRGPQVGELCRRVGLDPDPEQQLLLDLIFSGSPLTGRSTVMMIAELLARQNGKTGLFAMCCLGWLFYTQERLVIYSAHEAGTASELHTTLTEIIDGSDWLLTQMPDYKGSDPASLDEQRRATHGIYTANGQQRIETAHGCRILFKTRTKGGGRGLSANKVILDEAYALTPDQIAALLPTLSAKPDPQVLIGSSACRPESDYLRSVVEQGREGSNPRLAYVEWCAPDAIDVCDLQQMCDHRVGTAGCGFDKPVYLHAANPALYRRIALDWVETERAGGMPVHEFGRERLGWHDEPASGRTPIDLETWALLARAERDLDGQAASKIVGGFAVGLHVETDESATSISVCGETADGFRQVEVIMHAPGTGWVLKALDALYAQADEPLVLALDPHGPAGSLVQFLLQRDFQKVWPGKPKTKGGAHRLFLTQATEFAQACGGFVGDVRNGLLVHLDQPNLNRAVQSATTHPLADAYKFAPKDEDVEISPLVSATIARLAFLTFKESESWVGAGWT